MKYTHFKRAEKLLEFFRNFEQSFFFIDNKLNVDIKNRRRTEGKKCLKILSERPHRSEYIFPKFESTNVEFFHHFNENKWRSTANMGSMYSLLFSMAIQCFNYCFH